ncbi:MAG: ATP-binding protein [Syntrophorhabdales bacterium]|jgi:PAS domain S-box-containing protein
MQDEGNAKEQLMRDLTALRGRVAELEREESELSRSETAAHEARVYAEAIIDTVREPLVVLDENLSVLSASRSFYETFRTSPGETLAHFLYDLGNGQWDIPQLRILLEDIFRNTKLDNYEVDHVFPAIGPKSMLLNARRIFKEDVGTRMVLLAIEDITDLRQANEALKVSETRYRRLFETAQDGILILDADTGRISDVNPFLIEMLGYSYKEFVGKRLWQIGAVKNAEASKAAFKELQRKGYIRYEDLPLRTKSGREIDVEFVSNVYQVNHSSVIQCNVRDTTARKQMEDALREARDELEQRVPERTAELREAYQTLQAETEQRRCVERQLLQAQKIEAIGTLAGGIAHDFNNILAAIIGFSEMAMERAPKGERVRRDFERILSAGIRGRELVKQILTFSRQSQQEKKPMHLGVLLQETMKLLRASLPSTIEMRLNFAKRTGFILADPSQMQQVIMNLCTNAAHAMREKGGTIDVDLRDATFPSTSEVPHSSMSPGSYVRLAVTDTGEGVPGEIVAKIFEPFFTTKGAGEGTGLGLSVVLGIVESHGGAITVESVPERGATFAVYLPRLEEEHPLSEDEDGGALPRGHERILFIDDEELLAEMGEELLTGLGYQVVSRTGGREALAMFRLNPLAFDLVITDQTMPYISGLTLSGEMLSLRPDLPIILCTGFSHSVDAKSATSAGIKALLMKPVTKKEMAHLVRRVLDGHGAPAP